MKNTARKALTPILLAAGLMAAGIGIWAGGQLGQPDEPQNLESATYLAGGKPVTAFQLVDHHGEQFDNARLEGQWSFMFFGFTHCPDICPMTLAVLNEVEMRLEDAGQQVPLQNIFVSVDPQRDTPERLAEYVPYFNPGFLGVTGDPAQLEKLSRDLGILYILHDADEDGEYLVDHSSSLLLFAPDGELVALFRAPHRGATVYQDLVEILRTHR